MANRGVRAEAAPIRRPYIELIGIAEAIICAYGIIKCLWHHCISREGEIS